MKISEIQIFEKKEDFLKNLNDFLFQKYFFSKKFILVDENSQKYCFKIINNINQLSGVQVIKINSGEREKTIDTVQEVWEKLSFFGADRNSILLNLGGGVIVDLGGFAASTFKRGIDFLNIPTTLLSQVDASIGGKTGIDFSIRGGIILKNQIGVFNDPSKVFVFPGFIKTLCSREIFSGFAEIVKHALIKDYLLWGKIKKMASFSNLLLNKTCLKEMISRSIDIKNEIVLADPKEIGFRKVLNFGHTVGHAIESFSFGNRTNHLLHGEAIAIGIICEAYLSYKISGLEKEELDEISSFLCGKYPPYKIEERFFPDLIDLMKKDKKNKNEIINFSLLSRIGECEIDQNGSDLLILESLNYYFNLS